MNTPEPHDDGFQESRLASEMNVAQVHGSIMRERRDPQDGYEPISIWMIVLIWALTMWGGFYLGMNSGGFKSDVFNSNQVAWAGGGPAVAAGPPDPMVVGKKVFTQNCVVCHQANGQGVPGQFPPLVASEWVLSESWHGDNHLAKIVLHGLQGPIQVKGNNYNNAMAPWGAVLDDNKIAAVLTYIRNEWGNQAPPITPEFVASVRARTADRKEPWTQKELQATERELVSDAPPATQPAEPAPQG